MSQTRNVRDNMMHLIQTVNAPLPLECRMLPDGTILNRDTNERLHRFELNRRYLIAVLASIDIPTLEQPEVKQS
jgi:hypothetical protein